MGQAAPLPRADDLPDPRLASFDEGRFFFERFPGKLSNVPVGVCGRPSRSDSAKDNIDKKPVYFCARYGYLQRAFGSKLQQVT